MLQLLVYILLQIFFTRTTIEPEPYEIEVGIPSTDPEQDSRTCDPAATEKNDATEKGLEPVSPETTRACSHTSRVKERNA